MCQRIRTRPSIECVESRFYFSCFCAITGVLPDPIPEPTFVDGILTINGTDEGDRIELQSSTRLVGSLHCFTRGQVPGSSGGWVSNIYDAEFAGSQLVLKIQHECASVYYQVSASLVRGVLIEGAGGSDEILYTGTARALITMIGGAGDDTLRGGAADAVTLVGGAGDDYLDADSSGPAHIEGGRGRDRVYGSRWRDVIYGGDGDDSIYGRSGFDTAYGAEGNDTIYGEDGGDVLLGGVGQDLLDGGANGDHLLGEDSNDILNGDADNDILDGGAGTDTLYGGDGNDLLIGGRGPGDSMRGGAGNDKFRIDDVFGNRDSIWGEAGFDVLLAPPDADDLLVMGPQTR